MQVITYNPAIHDKLSTFGEDSTSYSIWACCWNSDGISSTDKSVVPIVRMQINTIPDRRRQSDNSVLPSLQADVLASFSELRTLPFSRRVFFPNFLQDDGVGGNDLDNFNIYKTNINTKILIDGVNFDSPFQYHPASSQTKQSQTYFQEYLRQAETNNATFPYTVDYFEGQQCWSLGSNRLTGQTQLSWQSPGDARYPWVIANDIRFTQPQHGDVVRGESWANIFETTYTNLTGINQSRLISLAPWNVPTGTSWVTPWDKPNQYYAWEKTLDQVAETHRVEYIFKQLLDKPWFTGTYSNYDTLNNSYDEWKVLRDYNTHYGKLGGKIHPNSKVVCAPVLYGQVDQIAGWGYVTNPTNSDFDLYRLSAPGAGVTAIPSTPYLSFLMDLQVVRSTIRDNIGKSFTPWVRNPADTQDSCGYHTDQRYWKEMIYHTILSGANPFNYFQVQNLSVTPLHNILKEVRGISKNGTFKACSNSSSSIDIKSDRIPLKEACEKGVISGGQIMSGQLKGLKLWRITVPPSGSNILVSLANGELVTVSSATRGFWYLSDTKPVINLITFL